MSVSNFVPKPHTPFQWEAQDTPEMLIEKHNYLLSRLHIKGVTFNYHETATSNLEAVFARGDRRICSLLLTAWQMGCKFDAWTEHFKQEIWAAAFEKCARGFGFADGKDMESFYCFRKRHEDETLPWSLINPLVTDEFMLREKHKAYEEQTTPDCRVRCSGCGVNKYTECFKNCAGRTS